MLFLFIFIIRAEVEKLETWRTDIVEPAFKNLGGTITTSTGGSTGGTAGATTAAATTPAVTTAAATTAAATTPAVTTAAATTGSTKSAALQQKEEELNRLYEEKAKKDEELKGKFTNSF